LSKNPKKLFLMTTLFFLMKKKDMAKTNPKLLTAKTEIQKPERYNSHQGKG
jgi:hypothetical protein